VKTRIAAGLFVFLLVNSGYIAAYPAATLFYMGNVVALAVGLLLMVAAIWGVKRYPAECGAFLAAGLVAAALVAFRFRRRQRNPAPAVETLKGVNAVDPEDVQMHYTAMLCYRGLCDAAAADREEELFRRFKANESSRAITEARRLSPEDNNERQPVHAQASAVLEEE
jgi:membrane protein implicated in regulation of membrane protease activity